MAARGAVERVAIRGSLGVQSFGRDTKPTRLRLAPTDIADLRYVFCELFAESGVRSGQGRMSEAAAKMLVQKLAREQVRKGKRPCKRLRSQSAQMRGAFAAIMGEDPDPSRVAVEPAKSGVGMIGIVVTPARVPRAERMPPELGGAIDEARTAFLEHGGLPWNVTQLVKLGDGRTVRVWSGVKVRSFAPSGGEMSWMLPCKGGEGGDRSLLDLERFAEFTQQNRHARGWRCWETLARMRARGAAGHVIVLQAAYGHRPPNARDDLWPRDLAPLVEGTHAARAARDTLAHQRGRDARERWRAWTEKQEGRTDLRTGPDDDTTVTVAEAIAAELHIQRAGLAREQFEEAVGRRRDFIDRVRCEAENILISASAAYRAARTEGT